MGLLDFPAPFLSWLDDWLTGFLPPLAKLILWAGVGAILSMALYRLLSPQHQIAALKRVLVRAQQRVAEYDGELSGAWPLIGRMLSLAVRRVALVLPATLLASLPLLAFIVWLDGAYGSVFPPPGEPAQIEVRGDYHGEWIEGSGGPPLARVVNGNGEPVVDVPLAAPVSTVHKRRWWNALIGNPAGYLPADAPIDDIRVAMHRQQFLSVGPDWLRGWEAIYFPALILFALTFKAVWRIE